MKNLSMRHLRYFDALAQQRHFGRAAELCAISQPALSVQIKELETLLGAALVERTSRQIRLTRLGETFAVRVREILHTIDELEDWVRVAQRPLTGALRLGLIPTVAPYLLPKLFKTLKQYCPDIDLQPREAITSTLLGDLLTGQLDAAIVALPVGEATLHEEPLLDEHFLLVRPIEQADKPVPNIEQLRHCRLLLLEEGHCFRQQALSFCKMSSPLRHDLIEGSSLSTLVQMVGVGIGVTLIPQMAVAVETRAAPVAVTELPPPCPQRTVGMVWRRSNPLADQLKHIADMVRLHLC